MNECHKAGECANLCHITYVTTSEFSVCVYFKGAVLIRMAFGIPERVAIVELIRATFKGATLFFGVRQNALRGVEGKILKFQHVQTSIL